MADPAYGSLPFAEQIAFFKAKLDLPSALDRPVAGGS